MARKTGGLWASPPTAAAVRDKAKVHGHPVISWERVVHVGSEVVIRD
jgi:hypothetical protein